VTSDCRDRSALSTVAAGSHRRASTSGAAPSRSRRACSDCYGENVTNDGRCAPGHLHEGEHHERQRSGRFAPECVCVIVAGKVASAFSFFCDSCGYSRRSKSLEMLTRSLPASRLANSRGTITLRGRDAGGLSANQGILGRPDQERCAVPPSSAVNRNKTVEWLEALRRDARFLGHPGRPLEPPRAPLTSKARSPTAPRTVCSCRQLSKWTVGTTVKKCSCRTAQPARH
jgi:hypothetical protein